MSGFIPMTPENAFQISAARRNRLPDDLRDRLDDWTRDRMMQEACATVAAAMANGEEPKEPLDLRMDSCTKRREDLAPEVKRLLDQGMSKTRAASVMGVSEYLVGRIMDENGFKSTAISQVDEARARYIRILIDRLPGESASAMARRTGLTERQTRKAFKWGRSNGMIK